jgi:hypothetical protein
MLLDGPVVPTRRERRDADLRQLVDLMEADGPPMPST